MTTSKHLLAPLAALLLLAGAVPAQDAEAPAEGAPAAENAESTVAPEGAVEDTVPELEALIALPPMARLGRESDENLGKPRNLFESEEARRSLLGDNPRFIYVPEGTDPMIIPWVREAIVAGELLADAEKIFREAAPNGDRDAGKRALDKLVEIRTKYPQAVVAQAAATLEAQVTAFVSAQSDDPTTSRPINPIRKDLPPWVPSNTTGILLDLEDPSQSIVLVGDYILRVGDALPRYTNVKVKEIRAQQVVYDYDGSEHLVQVKSN